MARRQPANRWHDSVLWPESKQIRKTDIFLLSHNKSNWSAIWKKKKKHLLWSVNNQTKNLPARHFSTAETLPPPSPCKHSTSNNVPSHNMQDKENNVLYFIQMTSLTAHASKSTHAHKRYYLLHKFTAKCLWSNKKVCGIYINKWTKLKITINSQLIFTVSA